MNERTEIAVENMEVCAGDANRLARCTVVLITQRGGCGLRLHGFTIRKGRGNAYYVNPPATYDKLTGAWQPIVSLCSSTLEASIRRAVLDEYHSVVIVDAIVRDAFASHTRTPTE